MTNVLALHSIQCLLLSHHEGESQRYGAGARTPQKPHLTHGAYSCKERKDVIVVNFNTKSL